MDIRYDHRFSLEETAAEIAKLEQYVGIGDRPLVEDETVGELQHAIQNRLAFASSELMTGVRRHREWKEYVRISSVSRQLMGHVALDLAYREFDASGDAHKTMQATGGYLNAFKLEMVQQDFRMRLRNSPLEEMKQRLAQRDKAQFALSTALSASAGGVGFLAAKAFLHSNEAQISSIDFSPSLGGVMTVAAAIGALSVRSAVRSGSRQMGSILGSQINASIMPYLEKFDEDDGTKKEELSKDLESMIGRYALRHLEMYSDKLGKYFHTYDFSGRDDVADMVAGALDVAEKQLHRSYGVNPKKEWPDEWYLNLPSRILRINLATS